MVVTGHTSAQPPQDESAGRGAQTRGTGAVSIRDVAAAAGVSYQTVSRVINRHPSVKESTREQVLAVIQDLGFRPNRAARALAGGPARAVTVLTSNTTRFGYAAVLQGIEEAARAAGFTVAVSVVESESPAVVQDAVMRAVEPGAALVIVAFDTVGTRALAAVPEGVPLVAAVETPVGGAGRGKPWAWVDDRAAATSATNYLLGLGHRSVHYVAIPSSSPASQRMAGWQAALEATGAPVAEPRQAGWTPRSGYEAGQILAADPEVTAVLCGNDDLAFGVIRAMREAGRAVPEAVSVVGFDDMPQSAYFTPSLTTVRLDFAEVGRACFALLQGVLDPKAAAPPAPWPEPKLIVRESAGPPPHL